MTINTTANTSPSRDLDGKAKPMSTNLFAGLIRDPNDGAANDMPVLMKPKRAHPASAATHEEKRELRAIIGPRLIEARRRAGLGQFEASKAIAMDNSTQLSLWERAIRTPPLDKLMALASLYAVSVDFILGESTDATRDSAEGLRHAVLRGVRTQIERVAEITVEQVERHARLVGPNIATVDSVLAAADKLLDVHSKWQRLNLRAFEVQRGSASVVAACEELEAAVFEARQKVRLSQALDGDLRRALAALPRADPALPGDEATG